MKSCLRPTSIDDLSTLREFLAKAFTIGIDAPFLNPDVMSWKYWERRDDWPGPRGYVLEREGAILAHAGIWPMILGVGPNVMRGIHMIDWASAKGSPGMGLALVQKLAAMFDFIYSIGGSEMTCKVLPAFGFTEYTRQWRGVCPLRTVPPIQPSLTGFGDRESNLVQSPLWMISKSLNSYKNWRVIEILPQEISQDVYLSEVAYTPFSTRPPDFFEYLLRCPAAHFSLYGIVDDRSLVGHFAISLSRGQARIAGVWLRTFDSEAWAAAYLLARQIAVHLKGAYRLVAVGSEGISHEGASQAGFRITQGPPVYMLCKNRNLSLYPKLQFQLSDDDATFLDSETRFYRT